MGDSGRRIQVSGGAYVLLAASLLMLPFPWVLGAILAATVHELFHIAAIRLCGGQIRCLRINAGGAVLQSDPLPRSRELICAAAGPVGSACLLLCARWLPRTAVCALLHLLFNLLPVFPLDGGRVLQCLAFLLLPPGSAGRLCRWVSLLCRILLGILALYAAIRLGLGILPLLLAAALWKKGDLGKTTCKPVASGVQ